MVGKVGTTRRPAGSNPSGLSSGLNSDIDADFLYTDPLTQKTYPTWMVAAIDELLYKIRHKPIWEIVDFCLGIWAKKYPKDYKVFLKDMEEFRKNRRTETASNQSGSMRNLVEVPRELTFLLNKIASHKIQDYGEHKFWRDFAKRYPAFRGGTKF